MVRQKPNPEQVTAIGKKIYNESIRAQVEPAHRGRFLVLDIESGDYQIGDDDAIASLAMLKQRPDGVLFGIRIGDEVAYRIGVACWNET